MATTHTGYRIRPGDIDRAAVRMVDLAKALDRALTPLLIDYAERIKRSAQVYAAVDEGDLRSTIRRHLTRVAGKIFETIAAGGMPGKVTGKMVDYAAFVEFGTEMARAQPFMTPAWHDHIAPFVTDAVETINRVIQTFNR